LAAVALLASGCGGSGESSVTTIGVLSAALADTAEASAFRVTVSSGLEVRIPEEGIEIQSDLNEEAPLMVSKVNQERQHVVMNMGAVLGPLLGEGHLSEVEIWSDHERLVIDTRNILGPLLEPEVEILEPRLGPFRPGVASIDLTVIGVDVADFLTVSVGSPGPGLSELALRLPAALSSIEQTSESPQVFKGTAAYSDLLEAQGISVADWARGAAAGIALSLQVDIEELTEFYVDFYESLDAEVIIELDERGLLHVFWTRADLSGIYPALLDDDDLFLGMTEQERTEAEKSVQGAVMVVELRAVYEADVGLEVPLPPEATEDRTEEWREFLINAGFPG